MTNATEHLEQRVTQLERALSEAIGATTECYAQCGDLTAQVEVLKRLLAEEVAQRRELSAMSLVAGALLHAVAVQWLAAVSSDEASAIAGMIKRELMNVDGGVAGSDDACATQAAAARVGELQLHRAMSVADELRAARQGDRSGSGGAQLQ